MTAYKAYNPNNQASRDGGVPLGFGGKVTWQIMSRLFLFADKTTAYGSGAMERFYRGSNS